MNLINYRIVKSGDRVKLCEVGYNPRTLETIFICSTGTPQGDTPQDLIRQLEQMLEDAKNSGEPMEDVSR